MSTQFSDRLALMRRDRGVSQRVASNDLNISQALLSHYENGLREPGLDFIVRACEYYGVSSDYLLGRSEDRTGMERAEINRELLKILDIAFGALCAQADSGAVSGELRSLYQSAVKLVDAGREAQPEVEAP